MCDFAGMNYESPALPLSYRPYWVFWNRTGCHDSGAESFSQRFIGFGLGDGCIGLNVGYHRMRFWVFTPLPRSSP
jgi:hypothetical protein